MSNSELLPGLSLFTLIAVVAFVAIAFAIYWSKRKNRPRKDGGDGST